MIYFTSICSNYLPKAMALAESVKRNCRDAVFVLCLVEREAPQVALDFPHFDHVVLAKDADWGNFDQFMFRHSIVEASTAVKGQFMRNLLDRFPEADKFVYLDPDVLVYSDFIELENKLDEATVVVCPHLLRPGNIDMEISSLAHGTFNLGFLAVSRSDNAIQFLEWWAERLFWFCYDDIPRGIFTDQKWIDLAPSFFDVHILKHHGYDFATWSLLGSDLREEGGRYVVNGDPLRFIHFSGFDSGMIERAMGWWLTPENRPTFEKLYRQYVSLLEANGQVELGKLPWSYAAYADGRKISNEARAAYREPGLSEQIPDPFGASDAQILAVKPKKGSGDATDALTAQQWPTLRMSANPGLLDKLMWSSLEIGVVPTLAKAFRKLAGTKN
ncbi:hypothetical protein J5837_01800 [Pseudoxanthomonas helianthi]|uniref:Glycosyl transferase n=1 Tax=Pseudoxanthomonas helianthi TaxID=1453541 RepID=A0A941ARJ6_9GAMM|nr:hypothetical protein [Pseudoxanthomonas helianthi]MBP3983144.1 hypothetical protein [Pseudoxanthomonas helianthi]